MLRTTIAGSLPKPAWLAEPNKLWPEWRRRGRLDAAKRDATLLAIKQQEDAGIDIVSDGEQARQHFVHGFLERSRASTSPTRSRWASVTIAIRRWCRGHRSAAPDRGCTKWKRAMPAPTPAIS